jgi:hypothetical protein
VEVEVGDTLDQLVLQLIQILQEIQVVLVAVDPMVNLVEQEILHQYRHHKEILVELVIHQEDQHITVEVVEVLAVQVATLHQQLLEMVEQDHHLLLVDHQ